MLPAKVLVPLTTKLDVPVLLLMAGLLPLMLKLPTVSAFRRSKLALLMVKALAELPKVPDPLSTKVPALIVVAPP
jgi:hypothetical protein